MSDEMEVIQDVIKQADVRYISFMGDIQRYDLAILSHEQNEEEKLVLDLQDNRFAKIELANLYDEGYLEHALNFSQMEAEELRTFIKSYL
ncbi:hypothetical protein N781_07685 [Pontibacillus halophilus JSM 076056 = DSM 19796]|uniref:DUF3055 domain-containing protein n=1 Tax=Pontibacillus halophilus JSM 076056 = DSM 19796 TaxID=1385510 RepID=A0A0A5GET9_9BACI|nr:SAV0927 family protein [Pontibacillus halophilus]KGX89635.1 hypothetical protein N781_07685 [Pontibacillus halophilus JSM 076056 = DSM 19796]